MTLNADVPLFTALVRREYLYDLRGHHGETEPVAVFGLASIPGRAVLFHVMTARGAQFARLPVSALYHRPDAPALPLDVVQLWDCFSHEVSVHAFGFLAGLRCRALLRDGRWYPGEYMFTVDWFGSPSAEGAGDLGHKNAHMLRLDNGCFALQPNSRIFWREAAFITDPFGEDERPDYLTNTHVWRCEDGAKWRTEHTDRAFYRGSEDS